MSTHSSHFRTLPVTIKLTYSTLGEFIIKRQVKKKKKKKKKAGGPDTFEEMHFCLIATKDPHI